MADTTFTAQVTRIEASWLNAINGFFYDLFQGAVTPSQAREALGIYGSVFTVDGTSRTLEAGDAGSYLYCTSGSSVTVTVPPDVFETASNIVIIQGGAGTVTLDEGSGVTINTPLTLSTRDQYSAIALVQVDTNIWVATGDLASS